MFIHIAVYYSSQQDTREVILVILYKNPWRFQEFWTATKVTTVESNIRKEHKENMTNINNPTKYAFLTK